MRLLVLILLLGLSGCSTVNIYYTVTGNENRFETNGRVISPKEVSTGVAASAASGGDSSATSGAKP